MKAVKAERERTMEKHARRVRKDSRTDRRHTAVRRPNKRK